MNSIVKKEQRNRALNTHWVRNAGAVFGAYPTNAPITRRSTVAGLALSAAPMALLAGADNANAQAKQTMPEKSLYKRLGGVFAIAAVVDHFSDGHSPR
jgi:hypothetical protein